MSPSRPRWEPTRFTLRGAVAAGLLGVFPALMLAATALAQVPAQIPGRPVVPTQGIYRAANLGIEYQFVPYGSHYAARITRIDDGYAPVRQIRFESGVVTSLEPGDLIVTLDDQVIDRTADVLNHVGVTTIEVIDVRTSQRMRGAMRLANATGGGAPPPPSGQSRRIHAILAVDGRSGLPGLAQNRMRMKALFDNYAARGQADVSVLPANELDRGRILDAVRRAGDMRGNTLVVYYSGHGATDPNEGHYLALAAGPPLFRSALRSEAARLQPRLTVILSDCCSNEMGVPPLAPPPPPSQEVLDDLFLRASGLVDVTAATYDRSAGIDESAWYNMGGGYFTYTLTDLLTSASRSRYDLDRDGRVSWGEIFPSIRDATNRYYQSSRTMMLNQGGVDPLSGRRLEGATLEALRRQREQRPQPFSLGSS